MKMGPALTLITGLASAVALALTVRRHDGVGAGHLSRGAPRRHRHAGRRARRQQCRGAGVRRQRNGAANAGVGEVPDQRRGGGRLRPRGRARRLLREGRDGSGRAGGLAAHRRARRALRRGPPDRAPGGTGRNGLRSGQPRRTRGHPPTRARGRHGGLRAVDGHRGGALVTPPAFDRRTDTRPVGGDGGGSRGSQLRHSRGRHRQAGRDRPAFLGLQPDARRDLEPRRGPSHTSGHSRAAGGRAHAGTARREGARRGRQPRQERVRRQHEPRAADAAERRARA